MDTVTSSDGTTIAFDQLGEGPAVILRPPMRWRRLFRTVSAGRSPVRSTT